MTNQKAHVTWFKQTFGDNKQEGEFYLLDLAKASRTSFVWDYLKQTGDEEYTFDTFSKAYDLIMAENV